MIGLRDVGPVRFAVDAQVIGSESSQSERVGGVGEFEGEGEIRVNAKNLPEAMSAIDEPHVGSCAMLVRMLHARFVVPLALIAVTGLAACESGSSKAATKPRTTTTTRRKRRPATTTSSTTAAPTTTSTTVAPVVSTTLAPSPVTTVPPTLGACGARAGAIFAAVQGGDLASVPLEKYTISDCRIANSNQIWSAVTLVPNPGSGVTPLTVALERIGSIWSVRSYAASHVACDAPPPVPQELRLGC